jgi:hypothetical protein
MYVSPFYSPLRGAAVEDLWHDNDECPLGKSIAPADRLAGTGRIRKHCHCCAILNEPVKKQKVFRR